MCEVPKNIGYLQWIDALKGFTMLLVVVYRICEKYACLEFVFHPIKFLQYRGILN